MITQHAWMFLSSFERLRAKLQKEEMINMAHLGPRAFEEIGGEVVQTTAFVLQKHHLQSYKGSYARLIEPTTQDGKEAMFLAETNRYTAQQDNFSKIPGAPVAYWASQAVLDVFTGSPVLEKYAEPRQGVKTLDNDRFLKLWHEVSITKTAFDCGSVKESISSQCKWFPYNKGGSYRKWYGNSEYLVNWENDGNEMKNFAIEKYGCVTRTITNIPYFFRQGLTWSSLTSGDFSLRRFPRGFIFDSKGSSMYFDDNMMEAWIYGLLNSKIAMHFFSFLSPTLDFNVGPLRKVPIIVNEEYIVQEKHLTDNSEAISQNDWDSFETSWDFKKHPMI